MNGFEIGNRALATRAGDEARGAGSHNSARSEVFRGKVLAPDTGVGARVGALDINGNVTRIFDGVYGGEDLPTNQVVAILVDAVSKTAVVLAGGGGGAGCAVSINAFGVHFG